MSKLGMVIGACSLVLCSSLYAKPHRLICATTNWRPYVQENSQFPGYTYELVTHAFTQAGYDVQVKFMPWSEALAAAKKGRVDVVFPLYKTDARAKDFVYSASFSGGPLGLYQRSTSQVTLPKINVSQQPDAFFKALSAYRFGVVKDYAYYPAFDANHALKKIAVLDDEANLKQLHEGKVDFVLMDKYVAQYLLAHGSAHAFSNDIQFVSPALTTQKLHIAVSHRHPRHQQIINAFNHGLREIGVNGTLSHLLDQDSKRMNIRALA